MKRTHYPNRCLLVAAAVLFVGSLGLHQAGAANILSSNSNFEEGTTQKWGFFVPAESKDKSCTFTVTETAPHSGKFAGKVESKDFARMGVGAGVFPSTPGQRFKITAWVKADATAEAQPGTPGIVIRAQLTDAEGKNLLGGILFMIGVNSKAVLMSYSKGLKFEEVTAPLPRQWTKIETVIEIPSQVNGEAAPIQKTGLEIFGWLTKGAFYVDDVSVEPVP